ncbi:PREDICTED: location of vulva defective 1-like isoform X1 [Amphimedon queenslandica]|uniref:Uncharacterized protein n=2 Tax=Amphimedon queenslandica TaxID=400682 RepID=A0AAN0J5A8_AMPQE|nr:PREDICTED: location of vulva defective 1-like isoform X1 [Amphimedon queenslandica]XP_019852199.1 PREDICTED: location of vulva defective 1-like isoform X1 [Amphimedon queenslandica]|eukprot:XP_019852196.1 PREDICTED: location of vulva defective 1-like isoform X1 [Amphimedon queenslandica]
MLSTVTALMLIILSLSFLHFFTGAMAAERLCLEKSNIINETPKSEIVLSVACGNGTASLVLRLGESPFHYLYYQLDYYCYHLNNMSLFKSEILEPSFQVIMSSQLESVDLQENSLCVFVCCAENFWENAWYFVNGNGSTCSNKVDISHTAPAASSSIIEAVPITNESTSEIMVSSSIMNTPSTTSEFSETTSKTQTFSTVSTSSSPSTNETTPSIASNPILATSEFSETTSKTQTFSTVSTSSSPFLATSEFSETIQTETFSTLSTSSSPSTNETTQSTASTTSSPSIIDNTVAVIFGVLILVIVLLIISCFIVIACTRKVALCTNKNVIIEIENSKIFQLMLPSEHLKDSHSLHTICADLNFKETSNIDSKENTTHTLETSGGSHTTTTTTDKLPHNDVCTNSIEYSEGSSGEVEGSCPELYDTSPHNTTYSSDYVVEESIIVHSLMNSSYITVAEVDIATCPSLN